MRSPRNEEVCTFNGLPIRGKEQVLAATTHLRAHREQACRWASRQSSTSASAGSDDATADHPSCLHTGLLHLRSRLERRGRITHQQVPAPTGAITNRCRAGGRKRKEEEEVPLEPKWPQATSFISSPPSLNLPVCQIPTYHVPPERGHEACRREAAPPHREVSFF